MASSSIPDQRPRQTGLHQPTRLQVSQNSAKPIWSFIPSCRMPYLSRIKQTSSIGAVWRKQCPSCTELVWSKALPVPCRTRCRIEMSPFFSADSAWTFGAAKPYWFQYQKISGALLKNPAVDILDQNPVLLQRGRTISASAMMNDAKSHPLKYLPLHAGHISMVILGTVSSLRCCSRSWQSMAVEISWPQLMAGS